MKQGKLNLAVKGFTAALELDPSIAEAYGNRGLALILLGKETEAGPDLKRCVELKPEMKTDIERRTELAKKMIRDAAPVH
jgi:tetratricopeptide (TPR) repeat protein